MRALLYVLVLSLVLVFSTNAFAIDVLVVPAKHDEFMQKSAYKQAFNAYEVAVAKVKEQLDTKNIAKLAKEYKLASLAQDYLDIGFTDIEAWAGAYTTLQNILELEIKKDWLRKNAKGAQGLYTLQNRRLSGSMYVVEAEEPQVYNVNIEIFMKNPPYNQGSSMGQGKLDGKHMVFVYENNSECTINMVFNGDTLTVVESKAFKEGAIFGANVSADGTWLREK